MMPIAPSSWDESYDVIVVGSGASGLSCALTAHLEGLRVLVLEKTAHIGGSTAVSGGAVWVPLNSGSQGAGHPDTYERVWQYLEQTVGDASPDAMKEAFLRYGPRMLDYLASHGVLSLTARTYSPDYMSELPGASNGGRALDPAPFDARTLGRARFRELRNPLKEFLVLGGMMVNLTDVYHLLRPLRSVASVKHTLGLLARYVFDRVQGYHRGTRLLLGNALAGQLFHAVIKHGVPYRLSAPVVSLLSDAHGGVVGVRVERGDLTYNVSAQKGVVLATGGFPWSTQLRDVLYPKPTGPWSMAPEDNRGDGISMAMDAGGALGTRHVSPAFWAPVSLLTDAQGQVTRYPHLVWDRAKPGLIALNHRAERFVNEADSYHAFVTALLETNRGRSESSAFLICDHRFIEKWGLGLALPGGRPRNHLIENGYLKRAGSLSDLAALLKIDPDRLVATVERYNKQAEAGLDTDFGKGSTAYNRYLGDPEHSPNPCLAPLGAGPYYAVEVVAGDIGTACGVQTNSFAQALDSTGEPISGLFVVGNDMQSVMGGAYPGPGITLGPGLTFGWVAAQYMAGNLPN